MPTGTGKRLGLLEGATSCSHSAMSLIMFFHPANLDILFHHRILETILELYILLTILIEKILFHSHT